MLKYACIYLDKQSSKYSKIMNVPDAVHSIRSLYKLLSCYQGLSVQCKIFKMECFTKRVMPEWRHASRYFSRQWRFCGTRKIWQTLQQKNKKKREKHLGVFSPRYSYIHILNERYTPKDGHNQGLLLKNRVIFHIFNKAVFPFRCAPVCVAEYALISLNIFKYP